MVEHPTRAFIDLEALTHNLIFLRKKIGPHTRVLGVVKADAYGHGAVEIARHLQKIGIDMLGVAYTGEGIALREAGIQVPVLVMTGALHEQMKEAIHYQLTLGISDIESARLLSNMAVKCAQSVTIHIKIDTGMGRLGFPLVNAEKAVLEILSLPNLRGEGLFTHLATAEDQETSFTTKQYEQFIHLIRSLSHYGISFPLCHMANSAAALQHPKTCLDMVRVGLMLYGIAPRTETQKELSIQPVLGLKTRIIHIKKVSRGSSISYGRSYICPEDHIIAVIPAGYSDGFARCMSGKAQVIIQGKKVPVIGTICMDMAIVDITNIKGAAQVGDEVILIGIQGDEMITAHDWAKWQGTIPYEVLCAVGKRVQKVFYATQEEIKDNRLAIGSNSHT